MRNFVGQTTWLSTVCLGLAAASAAVAAWTFTGVESAEELSGVLTALGAATLIAAAVVWLKLWMRNHLARKVQRCIPALGEYRSPPLPLPKLWIVATVASGCLVLVAFIMTVSRSPDDHRQLQVSKQRVSSAIFMFFGITLSGWNHAVSIELKALRAALKSQP